jgi:hypothetical protein
MLTPVELKGVVEEATKRGYPVQPVELYLANRIRKFSKRILLINGWRCLVYNIKNTHAYGEHKYLVFEMTKSMLPMFDFLVVYTNQEKSCIYIVPKGVIAREFRREGRRKMRFLIPQGGTTLWRSVNSTRGVTWNSYIDAWRLLG